jgi:hypothetical protein
MGLQDVVKVVKEARFGERGVKVSCRGGWEGEMELQYPMCKTCQAGATELSGSTYHEDSNGITNAQMPA